MDLEAHRSDQSTDSSTASACQDEDDPDIHERRYATSTNGVSRLEWITGLTNALKNLFIRTQYTPICHSPSSFHGALFISIRTALLSSHINVLLLFVPIGFATYLARTPPAWTFITNAFAIVPLSALLTSATERIAAESGDIVGALLNISLGNLVELIIFVALKEGHTGIVEASILGSVLVNILLILGSALLATSWVDSTSTYTTAGTQLLGCLLFVSVFALFMPTAYGFAFETAAKDIKVSTLMMSRATACLVLAIYIAYIFHELRNTTSSASAEIKEETPMLGPRQSRPVSPLILPPRTIRFAEADIIDDGEQRPTQISASFTSPRVSQDLVSDYTEESRGRPSATFTRFPSFMSGNAPRSRCHSRSVSLGSLQSRLSREHSLAARVRIPTARSVRSFDELRPEADGKSSMFPWADRTASILILFLSSLLMSLSAEFLVSTIDDITHHSESHLSETLIGLIILPIVGNIAEYITVVTVALRGKLDLAIAVSIGSSIQIALCVAPLTVIAAWIMHEDLSLTFDFFELASLVGTVLLVNIVVLGERAGENANALRGGLVCGCYGIITIGAFLAPQD